MASNDYQFFDYWRVKGTEEEVRDVITRDYELDRWWPAAYLDLLVIEPGDSDLAPNLWLFRTSRAQQ